MNHLDQRLWLHTFKIFWNHWLLSYQLHIVFGCLQQILWWLDLLWRSLSKDESSLELKIAVFHFLSCLSFLILWHHLHEQSKSKVGLLDYLFNDKQTDLISESVEDWCCICKIHILFTVLIQELNSYKEGHWCSLFQDQRKSPWFPHYSPQDNDTYPRILRVCLLSWLEWPDALDDEDHQVLTNLS